MNGTPSIPDILLMDPAVLLPCPWNPNRMDPEDELKLDASLSRHGMFKPVIVRTLADGRHELIGGHYRRESAIRLGMAEIPVIALGEVTDERAKEIMLLDNGRYGHDDAGALADLINSMGDPSELSSFLPYDLAELEAITATARINLDDLDLDEPDAAPVEAKAKATKTHEIMKFRVSLEDVTWIGDLIKRVMKEQGFTGDDAMTNAGEALAFLLSEGRNGASH